jgi:hypothetical protein
MIKGGDERKTAPPQASGGAGAMVGGSRFTRCALELARFDLGRRSPPGAVCSNVELPSFLSGLIFIHSSPEGGGQTPRTTQTQRL